MGIGGALFAHNVRFLSPLTFDPLLATFVIWAMLMVGGAGNNRGAVLGAFVVWGIWTGTQFLPGVFSDPNLRFFMIGVLIVAVILVRPGGILGERRHVTRSPGA
jgi:branched-chain amino acid transport system permease protein